MTIALARQLRMLADWQIRQRGYDPIQVTQILLRLEAHEEFLRMHGGA